MDKNNEALLASLALSSSEVTPRAWRLLVDYFGSPQAVLSASDEELSGFRGVSAQVRARVQSARERMPQMTAVVDKLGEMGAYACTLDDPRYPVLLKQTNDPPGLLYVRGDLQERDRFGVAIVGSRHPRPYGLQMARTISTDLARSGLTIVSGGARGIDGAAHEAALKVGGRTIAVLGCGIDISYPAEHKELFARIARQGAVISEFPPGSPPESWRFPRRNRIISGISRGVVVCDAPEDSGSLITATSAAEQGREVFAVPGNVDSEHNKGAHRLLKEGARLVESAQDVLEEFGIEAGKPGDNPSELPPIELSPEERTILEMLDLEPQPMDLIIEKSRMSPSDAVGVLTFLEMKRLVKRVAGPAYVRILK